MTGVRSLSPPTMPVSLRVLGREGKQYVVPKISKLLISIRAKMIGSKAQYSLVSVHQLVALLEPLFALRLRLRQRAWRRPVGQALPHALWLLVEHARPVRAVGYIVRKTPPMSSTFGARFLSA